MTELLRTPATNSHVQDAPDLGASTPNTTATAHASTVAVKWCQPGQCGDLLAVEHSQFRQLREQSTREHLADAGHRTEQLVALPSQRSVTNQLTKFIVETRKSLFQPPDVLIDTPV
jgi:hypothetical protein